MENHQIQSKPTDAEPPIPDGLSSSVFLSDDEVLSKPHEERTLEERVRCCEIAIGRLCEYNQENYPAIQAAWRHVPLDKQAL